MVKNIKGQQTLNSLPVLRKRVFRTLALTGHNISKFSDPSHFEQTTAIIINPMIGNSEACRNRLPQEITHPLTREHEFLRVVLLLRCDKRLQHTGSV
jgi:hypothetical protein